MSNLASISISGRNKRMNIVLGIGPVPPAIASFSNEGREGVSYEDISDTVESPILTSGDYLYINRGWTENQKISLAKLTPNESDIKGHADYILDGHSAYDDDGMLVDGSIPTYDGEYTVT